MFENAMVLPFGQNEKTAKTFEIGVWRFYVNRARSCEERHSAMLHSLDDSPNTGGRFWISHETKPFGIYSKRVNIHGSHSFIHRITGRVRESSGIRYLQLIFFSWWVGIVHKDSGQFLLSKGDAIL